MNTPINATLAAAANSATAAANLTTTAIGASVSITNQLDVTLTIYDQFDPSTEADPNMPLLYTFLAKVPPGSTTNVLTTRLVSQLVATISGALAEFGGKDYYEDFPVKIMSGTTMASNPAQLAYTVTAEDRSAVALSYQFQKFTMANPDSVLSKGFLAAAAKGFDAVNVFFSGTQQFKTCTMATWNAAMQWQYNRLSPWQGPFYLYATAPADAGPTLVATLSISSSATAQTATLSMCSADSQNNPLYGNPRQDLDLKFINQGVLGTSANDATVSASLNPVWMNVVQPASGSAGPQYLIGKAFTGTIAGIKVVSSQTARQQPGKPATKTAAEASDWDKMQKYGGELIGALAGLAVLYEMIKKAWDKRSEAQEKARQDKEAADKAEADAQAQAEADAELAAPADGVAARQLELEPRVQAAEAALGQQAEVVQQAAARDALDAVDASVAAAEAEVQAAVENGAAPNQAMEDAVAKVEARAADAREAIAEGHPVAEPLNQVADAVQGLEGQVAAAGQEVQAAAENASAQVKDAVDANQALDEAAAARDAAQQNPEADGGADAANNDAPDADPVEEAVEV